MKKIILMLALLAQVFMASAQSAEVFKPYKSVNLRLPSVPLIVSDPYFSIWSPFDKLTDGTTRHWTNDEKPLEGLLRVDGKTYRFMGPQDRMVLESVVPMADEEEWKGMYTHREPVAGWQNEGFDTNGWREGKGAFGTDNNLNIRTPWREEDSNIWVRREVTLSAQDLADDLYVVFSHDDACEVYINGTQVGSGIMSLVEGVKVHMTGDLKKLLHEGKNTMAMHCYNKTGGALVDMGIYRNLSLNDNNILQAKQKSVDVLACNTYYTFQCGPVELDLVFTAPMLINDLDLLSSPINYVSYQVRSTDKKQHNAQIYLSASPLISVNKAGQPTVSSTITNRGVKYLKTGTVDQPILAKTGDGICIDWGYLYMPNFNGDVSLGADQDLKAYFMQNGSLPQSQQKVVCRKSSAMPSLAYVHDFGNVLSAASYSLIGYDEIEDIEYFYKRYKGYWAHEGKVSIFDMFDNLHTNYDAIMAKCREFDKTIYDDGMKAGGVKYAEILSGSYRHVIAAHKIFRDDKGNVLFFSKENNSNGCVNTVDLTYPEAPLFLLYNTELQKGMMTSIFDYSASGRWTKPFAAHDLGQYPKANAQVYGGDMPLEEAGNMITLTAMIAKLEGNTKYADKYWNLLTTWTDYLVENGLHPTNQLCTDDFAGHWAGNCNLAIKAIMGITGYAELAKMKGQQQTYDKYMKIAKDMAAQWEKETKVGDHYELAYGAGANTWSQKYNMVWDKLWKTNVFPNNAMQTEIKYYLKQQNKYGLPLDCRKDYTKSDWIMWTAAMCDNNKQFQQLLDPLYKYINETPSRVPISDWHDTKTGEMTGFKARSVIGGYWMKVLADKLAK